MAVIEAGRKSGALITATYAMDHGKEIFALPGNINEPQYGGTNDLLRDGATPLVEVDDIIQVYIGRFPDKLKTGGELSAEIKHGYYEEVARMNSKPVAAKKSSIDIKKEEQELPKASKVEEKQQIKEEPSVTDTSEMSCSQNAKKIYLSFTEKTEFSDTLSQRSGVKGGDFIAAITELELFGFVKAVPVGRYERVK